MKIKDLFVDSRINPLGLDCEKPLFSWSFDDSSERSIIQTAYRIIVSEEEQDLLKDQGNVWDSGKVRSRRNINVLFKGKKLESRKRYFWRVQIWDQNGCISESQISWWEMGLLVPTDWSGKWIQASFTHQALPLFRHEFTIKKPFERARVYICGLGQYELSLNGQKADDSVLEPGWTHYDKTCLYSVYDVTSLLHLSSNSVGVMLGNGFYNVTGGRYTKFKDSFGEPKCLVQLEVHYTDGTHETFGSNTNWMVSPSPITFSCIYGGEDYDARLEQPGWDRPMFEFKARWKNAIEAQPPKGILKSQKTSPLKAMKTFIPVFIKEVKPSVYVADFGQNFSGWIRLEVQGSSGSSIKLIPAELLNGDGTANQTWTGSPYEYNYILKGDGTEKWNPRFTYYGFRYLQIEGAVPADFPSNLTGLPKLLSLEGEMIYPDLQPSGRFESSDTLLNKTHEIINWAILSNTKSVFTDCPHREKLGWLEQIHLMGPSIIYNYQVDSLLTKVLEDIQDSQLPNGMVPTTAPEYIVFEEPWDIFRHSVSWGATFILVPWLMYQKYGNTRVLHEYYENMKKYLNFIISRTENYIVKDGLGDWYDVGPAGPGFAQNTPVPLTETALFYHLSKVMSQISALVNKKKDTKHFAELSNKIKDAYNNEFFNPTTCQYAAGSQAANAMSLALGLAEENYKTKVFQNLLDDLYARGFHTTSGDIAHRFVLLALAENNRSDIIFKMTKNTDYPSYGYQIVHGATTLTEAWDGPTVGKSQNHFMLGHLEEWLYSGLAGLQYEFNPSTEAYQFTIKPHFEKGLDFVRVEHNLYTGKVRTGWENHTDKVKLVVQIPPNCSGYVYIPSTSIEEVKESGKTVLEQQGIEFHRYENGFTVLQIESGLYHFENIKLFKERANEHSTLPYSL